MDPVLLAVLWVLAVAMAVVAAYVIRRAAVAASPFDVALALFLLAMMGSMAGGFLLYEALPVQWGLQAALFLGMWVMVFGIGQLLAELRGGEKWEAGRRPSLAVRASVIAGALGTELVMTFALELASGDLAGVARTAPLGSLLATGITSSWFLFPMSLEMALSVYLARRETPRFLLVILSLQPVIMALSPTAVPDLHPWLTASVVGGGGAMTVVFVFVMESFRRSPRMNRVIFDYLVLLAFVFGLMMAGLLVWTLDGNPALFALSLLAEMTLFFNAILMPDRLSEGEKVAYLERAWPMFGLILGVFVAEFFMGALFDVALSGTGFLTGMAYAPTATGTGAPALPALFNGLLFVTGVLASPWFLIMMGAEMGALVAFKIRETRSRETRTRLSFVIGAYFVYAIFLPAFILSPQRLSSLPLIGWSMGIGTGGGFIPPFFVVIALTYAIAAVLSLLFGARQMCSGLCTAALMYQGTFYDSLKGFNRRSTVGNKLLGSKLSRLYGVVFSLSWASMTAAAALSYLDYVGIVHVTAYGLDLAYFTEVLYFNFLWYVVFLAIPFVGVYGCVSSGYCYWGTFNQVLGRLGFFRLKARDPAVCVSCETKPCTRACPVGLTDLPVNFIDKGEFKALKCIGVGDCVESCPYENILFWDVRHWLSGKASTERPRRTGQPLPMVGEGGGRALSAKTPGPE